MPQKPVQIFQSPTGYVSGSQPWVTLVLLDCISQKLSSPTVLAIKGFTVQEFLSYPRLGTAELGDTRKRTGSK